MHLAVYLPLLLPLLAAPGARWLDDRLHPRPAALLLAGGALVLAAGSTTVLGLLALAGLVRVPAVARLAELSPAVLQRDDPASVSVAVVAALLLPVVVVAGSRFVYRRVRAVCEAVLEAACFPGQDPLVVLEEPAADAFAMPGLPGRIVVSTGMLASLDAAEREVLLAHERAHLRGHHYLYTAAVQLAVTLNPLLRPLAERVAYTLERWADEAAAEATGDRRRVAVTVGKAALAAKNSGGRRRLPAAALGLLGRSPRRGTPGPVPRRVAALLAPPPKGGGWRGAAATACVAAAALCTADAVQDLHEVVRRAAGG